MARRKAPGLAILVCLFLVGVVTHAAFSQAAVENTTAAAPAHGQSVDYWSLLFVFALSTFIGIGVVARVSRLLHTPLMSITNAISAIAVVGSILVTGSDYPKDIRILGAVALFASMTNIVSGFLITNRMLKLFKQEPKGAQTK
ncbi:MAG TPA: NAD(P) transhydrogenase subunit alpha [Candidatus Krumholzibacteria bacterium]|nr:NAD(P) transhydrogenase subunit alpha [Candidatus Krumholzibacteria bacterium]